MQGFNNWLILRSPKYSERQSLMPVVAYLSFQKAEDLLFHQLVLKILSPFCMYRSTASFAEKRALVGSVGDGHSKIQVSMPPVLVPAKKSKKSAMRALGSSFLSCNFFSRAISIWPGIIPRIPPPSIDRIFF